MKNLMEELDLINAYYIYLKSKGRTFTADGFPVFQKDEFLTAWPERIVPFSHRNDKSLPDHGKVVICFYARDQEIYPRLEKVLQEIPIYRQYLGVIGMDVTVTDDMDEEWQSVLMLLNQLFLAVLAVNGIKIILNTRAGKDAVHYFSHLPKDIMCASGMVGCSEEKEPFDYSYLSKILHLLPGKLLIYGKLSALEKRQLDTVGVNYKQYDDFHTCSKKERHYGRQ